MQIVPATSVAASCMTALFAAPRHLGGSFTFVERANRADYEVDQIDRFDDSHAVRIAAASRF